MKPQIFEATQYMNLRETIEKAIIIARGTKSNVIAVFKGARFSVSPDTDMQTAIDTYLSVKDKITITQRTLNQNEK
jgi:hypothetical protein